MFFFNKQKSPINLAPKFLLIICYVFFSFFLISSVTFMCGAISSIVMVIKYGPLNSETNATQRLLYTVFISLISFSVLVRVFLTLLAFFTNTIKPYSKRMQQAYIFDEYKIAFGKTTEYRWIYWSYFFLPFFEFYGILTDPIRFLNKINKGEKLSIPNYPKWFDKNDNSKQMLEKYKNTSRFIKFIWTPVFFKKKKPH